MQTPYADVSEDVYRAYHLKQDRAQCRKFVRILIAAQVPLAYLDFFALTLTPTFFALLILRVVFALYSWNVIRRLKRISTVPQLQQHMLVWIAVALSTQVIADAFLPRDYLGHYLIDSWLAALYFVSLPLPLRVLRTPMIAFVLGDLALLAYKIAPAVAYTLSAIVVLPISAYSGYVIAQYLHRYRRKILSAEYEMDRRAHTDPVTGVANRAEFIRVSDLEIHRHARFGKPLSVLVLDLDQLKQISESFGPQASDIVLIEVSRRIKRATRSYDFVGRYGADEFCILLPDATQEDVDRVIARIRANVISIPISYAGNEFKVQAYTGVASMNEGENVTQILQRADADLYRAKHAA